MDRSNRLLGGLSIHVIAVRNLKKVVHFGIQDPYVQVGLNNEKKDTRQIMDGGSDCVFEETVRFNIDADPSDLLHLKVKHKSTFSSTTIGVFSISLKELLKFQGKKVKFQLVDDEKFQPTGMIEVRPEYHGQNEPPMPPVQTPPHPSHTLAPTLSASAVSTSPSPAPIAMNPSLHQYASSPQPQPSAPVITPSPQPVVVPGVPLVAPQPMAAIEPLPSPPHNQQQQPPQQPYYQPPAPVIQAPVVGNHGYQPAPYGSQGSAQYQSQQPGAPQQQQQQQPYGTPQVQFQKPVFQQQQSPQPGMPYQPPAPVFQPNPHAFGSQGPPPPYSPQQQQQQQQQQFGSQVPPQQQPQQQMPVQVAPFQTLAVGRPHMDSRMFDDMQYLGPSRSAGARIIEVRVFATPTCVKGIQLVYVVGGQKLDGPVAGATVPNGPTVMYINDAQGERIEAVLGRISAQELESLTLKTSRQTLRWSNSMEGQEFQLNIPQGHRVVGFHGSFSQMGLTSLGAFSTPF